MSILRIPAPALLWILNFENGKEIINENLDYELLDNENNGKYGIGSAENDKLGLLLAFTFKLSKRPFLNFDIS